MSEYRKAKELLLEHDGERFTAAQIFIAVMSDSDLTLMLGFCANEMKVRLQMKKQELARIKRRMEADQ